MRRSVPFVVVIASLGAGVAAGADAAGPTGNLIVDPGAELGLYADWATTGGFVQERYGEEYRPGTAVSAGFGGGSYLFAGGGDSDASSATQTVDVSGWATEIDADSATATLSARLGGVDDEQDRATVTATPLPQTGGTALGSPTVIGPVTAADRGNQTALLARSAEFKLPAGTRRVTVTIDAVRAFGVYTDGYADNVSLSIAATAPPTTPTTPTPTTPTSTTPTSTTPSPTTPAPTTTPVPTTTTPTPSQTPTVPSVVRRRGRLRGIKSPGRRIKGRISVSGRTCKSGRRVVIKKGKKTLGSGRTKAGGSFNIKTKKHKKGKLTVSVRKKTTGSTICAALTAKVPGRN